MRGTTHFKKPLQVKPIVVLTNSEIEFASRSLFEMRCRRSARRTLTRQHALGWFGRVCVSVSPRRFLRMDNVCHVWVEVNCDFLVIGRVAER